MSNNKCEICSEPEYAKVPVRVVESGDDYDGVPATWSLCKEHYADYDNQGGMFEPQYELSNV